MSTIRKTLTGLCLTGMAFTVLSAFAVAQQMPKTTKERMAGESTSTSRQVHGTVVAVEGNDVVVRMATGGLRNFTVPESRKFMIDGKELSVHELQPGTKLTATITTTTTPVTERTTTVGSGKVWYVSGNSVILTLPNGENHMYKVNDSFKFNVNGQPAGVHDLRKGMTISAEKIVEEPKTEMATNTEVTGHAPAPKMEAAAPAPAPAAEPAPVHHAAPAPAPEPQVAETKPAALPHTGSELPLIGLLGVLFTGLSFGVRKIRLS
jgi:hypothetical protein